MFTRLSRRLTADQRGFTLPDTLVSVIISSVCMTAIIAATIAFNYAKLNVDVLARTESQVATAETRWRADVSRADVIIPNTDSVQFTAANADGNCVNSLWKKAPVAGTTPAKYQLTIKKTVFKLPFAKDATGCTGTVETTVTEVALSDVAVTDPFSYKNAGGNLILNAAGTLTLEKTIAGKPATVSDVKWLSSAIKNVRLTTTVNTNTAKPVAAAFSQTASRQTILNGVSSSTFVPVGN